MGTPLESGHARLVWHPIADAHAEAVLSASEALRDVLDRQHIVWVEGAHLPQRISLDRQSGLSLVGVQP